MDVTGARRMLILKRLMGRDGAGIGRTGRVVLLVLLGGFLLFDAPGWTDPALAAPAVEDGAAAAAASSSTATSALLSRTLLAPRTELQREESEGGAVVQEETEAAGNAQEEDEPQASDFFLVLISILIFAKVFGELAERIGQPAVLGELVAGLILGGSVLGLVPTAGAMGEFVHLLAEVGVAILLFEIGLETDLKEMFRVGKASTLVATVGVFTPFLLGFLYWFYFDPFPVATAGGVSLMMVAIFVGATLTATSVGITARVLADLGLMHRSESRIIIGAAVIDDVLGLVILAVVSALAAGGIAAVSPLGIVQTFVIAVGFLVVAVIVGNFVAPSLFTVIDRMSVRGVLLVSAFSFALLFAALADKAGSAMIIGAFAAGIVLSSTNQFDLIVQRIKPVADVFTPIFFVSVGAVVNVHLFNPLSSEFNLDVILVAGALVLLAVVGKIAAGFVVGWGKHQLNRIAIGVGMVPRGEVGLIFAQIGLREGILSTETYAAILIMVIVTTFIAPPLLKIVFKPEPDELAGAGSESAVHAGQ